MFGLDDQIASLGDGGIFLLVVFVAILLGLRHASDPDHLTAVTTLIAGEERDTRGAAQIGLAWGLGHATSLFVFGVPIVLFSAYLPETLQMGAEAAVGVVIILLALRLLWRWRRGPSHAHAQSARTRRQAYGIGLVHGMGGSAGVGVLLLASIPNHAVAIVALALFAICTAISMAAASTGFGFVLTRPAVAARYAAIVPALGVLSLAFGLWYMLGAVQAVPYVL
jgi:High-affinity nickel-transport protein